MENGAPSLPGVLAIVVRVDLSGWGASDGQSGAGSAAVLTRHQWWR